MLLHPAIELFGELGVLECEDAGGEQSGIFSTGGSDGESGHGDTTGHLNDGQERVEAVEGFALHRYAEYGEVCHGGDHAGQVGCPTGTGDDDLNAPACGGFSKLAHPFGGAVSRHDEAFVRDTEVVEDP